MQAAINAAAKLAASRCQAAELSQSKPSDAPILILTLTSDTFSQGELPDFPSTQLAPTIFSNRRRR
ncbi:hypothetical protein ACNKHU_12665 [Shigella flexneri]